MSPLEVQMYSALTDARRFIDDIMPSCAAGYDDLNGVKNKCDQAIAAYDRVVAYIRAANNESL